MSTELQVPQLPTLTPAERRTLLWLARQSIHAVLQGEDVPTCATVTPALSEPAAAFVSLHQGLRLRGCIGTLVADRPLYHAVARMARMAAFEDPRFPPLSAPELSAVVIEISRLSALVRAQPEQICPGRHGVCVTCGERRGVFLPQVALTHDWDRETLLSELCSKAMLPSDAWKQPQTTLMAFTAEIFADS
jgi:AmmeMemoRadiSam system protein A